METALITAGEFDNQKETQALSNSRLADFAGASISGETVSAGMPEYSEHATLVSLTDGLSLEEAAATLDASKNRLLTIQKTDNLGAGVSVSVNPTKMRFSAD